MPKVPTLNWSLHKLSWSNCGNCDLCEGRSHVVLARGKIPCDVLFVGEAPGFSEDTLSRPFVGNAGKLLDDIIEEAEAMSVPVRKSWTNLISCIPLDEDGNKVTEPKADWIKACQPRLQEFVELAKPEAIVMVGKLSQKWCPKVIDYDFKFSTDIIHPAALLRLDISQRPLAIQRTIVKLRDLFESLVPF